MIRIIVLGKNSDSSITRALLRSLGKKICIEAFGEFGSVRTRHSSPDAILIDTESIAKIDECSTILIFKKDFCGKLPKISSKCTAVLDESNTALLNSLIKMPFPSICCGLSQRNTLTVSSMQSGDAVISLQRELFSISGNTVEPSDISVRLRTHESYYTLMAVTAAHLLLDIEEDKIEI